ncbi:hypothetical protein [Paenibacillus alkalitolerans]|uniref:hypothetical protein n=1 Tax=Paenibacillus alkalitolerans TaxID=2799335 RepID=UPI0018F3B295|nr:hypothetical protein [Paenibacillus alkalitolerans]
MDVSGIVRALIGAPQPSEGKLVELKAGQVVRGVVLKLLAESEALMNIMGTTVRARLETPLAQGQSTLLQVQPETAGGLVVLKPLASSVVDIVPESLPGVLKSVGLKDTPVNRMVIRAFHSEGLPLTKESAEEAAKAVQGAGADGEESAVKAAVIAARRGLPLSAETVGALRTAMFGEGLGGLVGRLEKAARELFAASRPDEPSYPAVKRLLDVLSRKDALANSLLGPLDELNTIEPAKAAKPAPTPSGGVASTIASASSSGISEGSLRSQTAAPVQSHAQAQTQFPAQTASQVLADSQAAATPRGSERPPVLALLQWLGVDMERQVAKAVNAAPFRSADAASPQPVVSSQTLPVLTESDVEEQPDRRRSAPLRPEALPASAAPGNGTLAWKERQSRAAPEAILLTGLQASPEGDVPERTPASWTDTLKAALLQLQASDDIPAPLKEAAQQTVQWITGQQLLLASDRSLPFAYVTMFIPFAGGRDGNGSASVHIQTRKGKHGEWDAENCRLWFDLRLSELGETGIDVQVTNKIVTLHVFNDHPASLQLIEGSKEEIELALERVGYRLSSLRASPVPQTPAHSGEQRGGAAAGSFRTAANAASVYGGPAYRGVDVRI